MQLLSTLAILAAITLGIAQAKPSPTVPDLAARHAADEQNCGKDEFFYLTRSCCLSHGGPPAKPSPPSGVSCPSCAFFSVVFTLVSGISTTNDFFYSMVLASRPGLLRTGAPEPAHSFVPEELRMGEVAPVLHT